MEADRECERLISMLATLKAVQQPSADMTNAIELFEQKLANKRRFASPKYFEPYRNSEDRLVLNSFGDTEDDE